MIILGGKDDDGNVLSSGFIYDARTEHSTPLPNDMPAARYLFCAVSNKRYMYVIGGVDADSRVVNTVYRLSLETYECTTMAPMGTVQSACAVVLLGNYIYIFGGRASPPPHAIHHDVNFVVHCNAIQYIGMWLMVMFRTLRTRTVGKDDNHSSFCRHALLQWPGTIDCCCCWWWYMIMLHDWL